MPKRPEPLETLQLSLELLRRIPRRGTTTAPELRRQLADAGYPREPRTIQRLLETLTQFHDIERDIGSKPFRYCWKEGAKGLSLPGLSRQESLLLTLAEQQLGMLLPAKLMRSMGGFFAQARGELGAVDAKQREREWLDKVRVVSTSQPLLPPKVDPEVFEQVSDALYNNQWLDVHYQNAAGKKDTPRVMPLGLAQQGPRMYLVCRYEGYDNERCLALHRMTSAKATDFTFDRPKDFDLKKFDDDGRFGYGDGTRIRLSFTIDKAAGLHVVECPLSADQQVVELADAYEIAATVVDSDMLDWWLLGFGDAVSNICRHPIAQ
ncbi:helix-turn-helix transcriptional regulator [Rhodoferax sp.]|uniref:helix-turn-helix transcriptional regulator n=1 Tax=Rhodoferax sp. TaxID=50421 RepID=UPI002760B73C|nr:WYL domain-containing protein [Rhodoferax sp.]